MRRRRIDDAGLLALLVASAGLAFPCTQARADAPEAPPAAGGLLRLSAEPARLLLGRDGGAELRIATPADVEDVTLTASAGRVEGLRRVPGGFAARYRAPSERFPQVAIVAALGRTPHGAEHGWLAIPLSGQGEARVRTSPGQVISLQIGDRTFGPRRADRDGLALIPVIVPPGVREAHQGFRPIDLHVPETQLLLAMLDRPTVLADRPERVKVFAYVVAPHGAARRGDVPVFEPSRGSVSVAAKEPGCVEGTWTLPPGRAGEERLAIRLPASSASRTVLRLEAVAGPLAVVAVSFDRDALVADGAGPGDVTVTARALDAAGNTVPATLALSADAGQLTAVRQRDPGEIEAHLRAGPAFEGRTQVRVTASAEGPKITGARVLELRSGEPAVARFEGARGVLLGDGARASVLHVAVADRHGNPVAAPPAVTAERGKVLGVAAAAPGQFDVRYVAPAVSSATRERLVATVGPVRTTAEPLLVAPPPRMRASPHAGALVDLQGRFAGARGGVSLEAPLDSAPLLAYGLEPSLRVDAEVVGLGAGTAVALLGGAALARPLAPWLVAHASATAGALLASETGAFAAQLSLGVSVPGPRVVPFVETALLTGVHGAPGAFAALGVAVGVRWSLESPHGDDTHRR